MPASKLQRVSHQLIVEWLEGPVTLAVKATVEAMRDETVDDAGLNAYCKNDAQATQERLAYLTGAGQAYQEVIDALDGEGLWELEEEEEDDDE